MSLQMASNDPSHPFYFDDNGDSQLLQSAPPTDMSCMSLKEVYDAMEASPEESMKYDPYVGTILTGLGVDHVISKFIEAKMDMTTFLTLTEDDLIAVGVPLSNTRTKILNGIKKLHRQKWDRKSIPYADTDAFTLADGVEIMSNLAKHLQFLVATVIYTTKQLEKGPVLLPKSQNIPYSTVLLVATKKGQVLTERMVLELCQLNKQVIQVGEKDNFAEADLITILKPCRKQHFKFPLACLTVTAVICGALFGLWRIKKSLMP